MTHLNQMSDKIGRLPTKPNLTFLAGLSAGALILAVAGCTTPSPQVQLTVSQAMSVAEAATDGVNVAVPVAAPHLTPAQATTVKKYLDDANSGVGAAHSAYVSGNLTQAAALATTALTNLAAAHDAVAAK